MASSSSKHLHIYVLHARWLRDRDRVVHELRQRVGAYRFQNATKVFTHVVSDDDPDAIDAETIRRSVDYTATKDELFDGLIRNMHIFQLSSALKHYRALKMIAEQGRPQDFHVVLEDDVLYQERMCLQLDRLMDQRPIGVTWLGMPSTLEAAADEKPRFQSVDRVFRVLPYCDSYAVDVDAAKTLSASFLPIKFTGNVQWSYVLKKTGVPSNILCPNIFMDGSKAGMFLSTADPNNQLIFHPDYLQVKKAVEDRKADDAIDDLVRGSGIRTHPDLMYVYALYQWRVKGDASAAQRTFAAALDVYQANACILGQDSAFLKDYMRTFRDTQDAPPAQAEVPLTMQNR